MWNAWERRHGLPQEARRARRGPLPVPPAAAALPVFLVEPAPVPICIPRRRRRQWMLMHSLLREMPPRPLGLGLTQTHIRYFDVRVADTRDFRRETQMELLKIILCMLLSLTPSRILHSLLIAIAIGNVISVAPC